jgi:UDP-glucose 4-epimerase
MKLFVTGSTGFIGSHFLLAALAAGHEVTGLRFPGTEPVIPIPDSDRLTWVEGDLTSFLTDLSTFHFSPSTFSSSALVHLAAYGVSPQPCTWEKAFQINVLDSISLMERAVEAGMRKIIVCGSCVEYGSSAERYDTIPPEAPLEPIGPYAASKAAQSIAASALCREKGIDLAILRLFTVFGEGQNGTNLWPSLKRAALAGEDFPMTHGEQIRDFIPVEQVAQAFLRALELPPSAFSSTLATRHPSPVTSSSHLPSSISNPASPASAFSFQPSAFVATIPLVANIGTGHPQTILEFCQHWWKKWGATGNLLPGALPYRDNEVMRYVPEVDEKFK